jgi:hypothetical protein
MHAKSSTKFCCRQAGDVGDFLPQPSLKLLGTFGAHRMADGNNDWFVATHTARNVPRELRDNLLSADDAATGRNFSFAR